MKPFLQFVLQNKLAKLLPIIKIFIIGIIPCSKIAAQCTSGSCTQTINSANNSNITVTSGQVICVVSGGSLTGSLTINSGGKINLSGGSITSSNANISGLIIISSGTFNPSNLTLNSGGTICNGNGQTFSMNNWNFNGGIFNNYGTFSGSLNLGSGTAFYNYSGATLTPSNSINTFQGTLYNYGNADFSQGINVGSGGIYDSYGTTRFRSNFNWNGAFTVTNEIGGIMTFDQNFNISQNSSCINHGRVYVNANFNVGNGSSFTNTGRIEITGGSAYDGNVTNSGLMYNIGPANSSIININSSAKVRNTCRFITTAGFNNNSPNTTNDGLIWVLDNAGNYPNVQINATYTQTSNGLLRGGSFSNQSIVAGSGNYYFTGTTINQGTFGSGSDAPNFYDISNVPTSSNRGFDTQTGSVSANETRNAFVPKDTSNYTYGCDADFTGVATAKDSTLATIGYPQTSTVSIPINSFTGTSTMAGAPYGAITKLIFTGVPSNCSYITINGVKYGSGYTTFPSNGDTISTTGGSSALVLGVTTSAQSAGKVFVPFKVMNSEGQPSANTANVTQPFSGVLPVTFGNISATAANCVVTINFETLSESNNKEFVIRSSTDGNSWAVITTIPSKSDGNTKQDYSYTHTAAATGSNYYRIEQVDKDGKGTFSNTVFVNNNCSATAVVTSYPNPVTDHVTVSFANTLGQKIIRIVDISGRVLKSVTTSGNAINIPANNLTPGIYGLEVIADGKRVYTQKLLRQ